MAIAPSEAFDVVNSRCRLLAVFCQATVSRVCHEPPVPRVSNSRGSVGTEWANAAGFLGQSDYSTTNPLAEFPATEDIQAPRFRQTRKSKEVFRISSAFVNMDGTSKDIIIPFSEATKVERLSSHAYKVNLVSSFCIGTGEFKPWPLLVMLQRQDMGSNIPRSS